MPLIPLLGQLIASGGLPVVARVLGGILAKKDGPLKEAGDILLSNSSELGKLSGKDEVKLALAQLQNDKAEIEGTTELLIEQQKTQRDELVSSSWMARNWRPYFGIIIASTWGIQMLSVTWAIIAEPELAPSIIGSFAALSSMWIMGFAAVGVNIHSRTKDKKNQMHMNTGTAPSGNLLQNIMEKFGAK